jgi:uncharacterized repeat protein (TIGR02543 family)
MRLPTLFETSAAFPGSAFLPAGTSPAFSENVGVPSVNGASTLTATTHTPDSNYYWIWSANSSGPGHIGSQNLGIRCVIPGEYAPFKIVYDSNGASGFAPVDSGRYAKGNAVTAPDSSGMSKSGYRFTGWTVSSDGSGTAVLPGQKVYFDSSDMKFFAKWERVYSVTYDSNGATSGERSG